MGGDLKIEDTSLAIGIPNCGTIKSQTIFALFRALKATPCKTNLIFQESSVLHWNREVIVKSALKLKATHLLFLDDDMFFDRDAIVRLLAHDKDVAGVNYNCRKFPAITTLHDTEERLEKMRSGELKGLVEVDAVGTGFMLIKLEVFSKLKHPWFFWKSDEEGEILMGEDYWFCEKAREAGYKVWADLDIPIKHIGEFLY